MGTLSDFFERDGVSIAFHSRAPDGIPVIFQHGLCGDHTQPQEVFPDDTAFRHIVMDARGHGASDAGPVEDLSIATFAADLAGYIEEKDIGPVIIGGISMGAAIALHLACHRPHLVSAAILARPAWIAESGPENMRPNMLAGELLLTGDPEEAKEKFETSAIAKDLQEKAPDNLKSLRGFFSRQPSDLTGELLTRISADGPGVTLAQIAALQIPTLVIGTDQDVIHPFGHAETLAGLIPGAKLARITAKGQDKTAYVREFKSAMSGFLKEIE